MKAILHYQHNEELGEALRSLEWSLTERKFVPRERASFDELCEKFPKNVHIIEEGAKAGWGAGYYVKGADGKPMLYNSDYDSSD